MKDFIRMSRYAGMREDLIQAGGGNSSYKISNSEMVIKASGYQLADVSEEKGFAVENQKLIRDMFLNREESWEINDADSNSILNKALIKGSHPSIETFLHAISGKYTLHTHPIVVNAMTCRKDGMQQLNKLFPKALLVPYATPGIRLAEAYFTAFRQYSIQTGEIISPDVVFLQNHGLVVSGDDASTVIHKTEETLNVIEDYLDIDMSGYHTSTMLSNYFPDKVVWRVNDVHILETYRKKDGMWEYAFCPDCVVFLGKKVLNLPADFSMADIENFKEKYSDPVIINYEKGLYLIAESVQKAMEIQSVLSFSAQVMTINDKTECYYLSDREKNILLDWDAEKYRRAVRR